MVDDTERAAYEIALRAALRDQARATATVDFLREKLGLAASGPVVLGPGDEDAIPETARDVGPVMVTDGEFYGMSQMKAAETFLERAGRTRPQRTEAIIAALRKGGVPLPSSHPESNLYSHLIKTPRFRRVGKGTWGLSAWYGPVTKRPPKAGAETAPDADDGAVADSAADEEGGPSEE